MTYKLVTLGLSDKRKTWQFTFNHNNFTEDSYAQAFSLLPMCSNLKKKL